MAPPGSPALPRNAESGTGPSLTAGAIAGIACGAGALFLGAAALFVIYWRRQRQLDRQDNLDVESVDERGPPRAMAPAVTYTMDYKVDDVQHHEGEGGGSYYTHSPGKPSGSSSPLGSPDTASAMPTHPAYIPRALVRGSSTPSSRSTATTSPPPFPSPPVPSTTSHSKPQPSDTATQAYWTMTASGPGQGSSAGTTRDTSTLSQHSASSFPSQPTQQRIPPAPTRQSPTQIPALAIPPATETTQPHPLPIPTQQPRKPRAYIPPRLNLHPDPTPAAAPIAAAPVPAIAPLPGPPNTIPRRLGGDKPLQGKESTTISGPLAFPELYPPHPHRHYRNQTGTGTGTVTVTASGWTREEVEDEDSYLYSYADDDQPQPQAQHWQGQGQGQGYRGRALTGEDGERERERERERDKGKKHGRKRSDRNSGGIGMGGSGSGGGGSGGNRHYAEIEIGRGSDIW